MNNLSVFGSTGFIGNRYCEMFPDDVVRIERDNRIPETNNILYLISTTDNYNVFTDLTIDIKTNLLVLVEVLRNCKPGDTINFISSWFCYGRVDLPAKETSYCNPKGFYSITKRAAEQLLISYCETFGLNYRILRLANVIGETDKGVSKKKNALQYLIEEMKENKDINLYYGGYFIRDYIYVDDVCRAINLCICYAPINDIINIGSGKPCWFIDLMLYCKQRLGSKSVFNSIEPNEFHRIVQVKDMFLDSGKLESLGFVPKYNIEQALDKLLKNNIN